MVTEQRPLGTEIFGQRLAAAMALIRGCNGISLAVRMTNEGYVEI